MIKLRLLVIPILLASAFNVMVRPAHAAGGLVTCTAEENVTYRPPLTNSPQNITITISGALADCTPDNLTSSTGTYNETTVAHQTDCTKLLETVQGTRTFRWSSGAQSTYSYTRVVERVNGNVQVTFTGTITSGLFSGEPATEIIIAPETDLAACSTTGVTQLNYLGDLTIGV